MRCSAGARSAGALVSRRCASRRRRVVLRAVVLVFVVAGGGVEVFQGDPLEFLEPLLGVGVPVRVGRRGPREPGPGLFGPARRQQGVGVRVEQGRGPGPGPSVGEFRDLEHDHGGLRPALVPADPGLDDEQFDLAGPVERGCFRAVHHGQRAIQASQRAFRIGHHRQVRLPAGEPSRRAQLGKGLGPLADPVGGDPGRLTDDADPGREVAGHPRVRVGAFRIRPRARRRPAAGPRRRPGRTARSAVRPGRPAPAGRWSHCPGWAEPRCGRRRCPAAHAIVVPRSPRRPGHNGRAVPDRGHSGRACHLPDPGQNGQDPGQSGRAVRAGRCLFHCGTAPGRHCGSFAPRRTAGAGSAALRTASTGTGAAAPIRPAGTAPPSVQDGTAAPIRSAGTGAAATVGTVGSRPATTVGAVGSRPATTVGAVGSRPATTVGAVGSRPATTVGAVGSRSATTVGAVGPGSSAVFSAVGARPAVASGTVRAGATAPVDRLDADPVAVRGPVAERRRGPGSFPVTSTPNPVVRGRVLRGRSSAEREPAPPSRGPHRVSPRVGAPPGGTISGWARSSSAAAARAAPGPGTRRPGTRCRPRPGPPPVRAESPPLRRSAPPRRSPPGRASSPVRGHPVLPARRPALRWPP